MKFLLHRVLRNPSPLLIQEKGAGMACGYSISTCLCQPPDIGWWSAQDPADEVCSSRVTHAPTHECTIHNWWRSSSFMERILAAQVSSLTVHLSFSILIFHLGMDISWVLHPPWRTDCSSITLSMGASQGLVSSSTSLVMRYVTVGQRRWTQIKVCEWEIQQRERGWWRFIFLYSNSLLAKAQRRVLFWFSWDEKSLPSGVVPDTDLQLNPWTLYSMVHQGFQYTLVGILSFCFNLFAFFYSCILGRSQFLSELVSVFSLCPLWWRGFWVDALPSGNP